MLEQIRKYIDPPIFAGDNKDYFITVLRILLIILLIASPLVITTGLIVNNLEFSWGIIVIDLMVLGSLWLLRRGFAVLAAFLLPLGLSFLAFYFVYAGQGLNDPALLIFPLVILSANLLLGRPGLVLFTLASMAYLLFIFYAEASGRLITCCNEFIGVEDIVAILIILAATAALLDILTHRLKDSLLQSQRNEEALRRRTDQLTALREIGLELGAQLELESLLQTIAAQARKLLNCNRGGFHLYRPDRQALELVVKIDPSHPLLLGSMIKPGEGVVGKVWQTDQPLVVNQYRQWPEKSGPMAQVSSVDPANVPGAVAGVPVRWGNEILGVLIVASEAEDYFTETEVELLNLFAAQAAVAIHNAHLHEQLQHHALKLQEEVADRKQAEERLKEYSERLEEMVQARTKSLEETQERLIRQEKLAILGQLAGSIGHELRNPLGVINNALYFLQMVLAGADETVKEYLELIAGRVAEADKIVADLLNLSRTRQATRQQLSVVTLLEETLRRYPLPEGISLHQAIPPDLPAILVDPQQLGQVLTNLVTNAYQAMPDGGQLILSAQADADWIRLSVSDTGAGMSPETVEKIFEPLFTTKAQGIGLGLAISKNLVEINGGTIEVESEEERGSTFTITLPLRG